MDSDAKLQVLWDRTALGDLMNRFGRGLDLHDWALYESCFQETLIVDFEQLTSFAPVSVSRSDWTAFARAALGQLDVHHQYSNATFEIDGNSATGTIYMVARHSDPSDFRWNTQYGWYENVFERRGGDWKITRLGHKFRWISGAPDLLDMQALDVVAAMSRVFGNA